MEKLQEKLFDLILRFNRRLTFIIARLSPPLTLNESHTLGEIGRRQLITAAEIGRNLVLEKSIVSRLLASLEERGLISNESSPTDGRVKHLKLTPSGRELFEKDDALRSEQVKRCVALLPSLEQADLLSFLSLMADSFQASEVPLHPSDHPLKVQIRRLTRAMGFLGDNLLDTGLSVQKSQVLSLVSGSEAGVLMADLKEKLPYEASMLSRLVSSLHLGRLIRKDNLGSDRRRVNLKLTSDGVILWNEKCRVAGRRILGALQGESSERISQFVSLLDKFLDDQRLFNGIHDENGTSIKLLKGEEQLQTGRSFLVEALVRNGQHGNLPERLFSRQSLCLAAYRDDKLKSVIELGRRSGEWHVLNFVFAPDAGVGDVAVSLLAAGFETALNRRGAKKIFIDQESPACQWLGEFSDKTRLENSWVITGSKLRDSR